MLDSLIVPVVSGRRAYTFVYNAQGWLDSVIAPYSTGMRRTKLTTDSTGRVSQIRDPDSTTVSFGFDPVVARRIASRTDRRNFTTSFTYDAGGRVTQHSTAMGNNVTIAQQYRPL